MERRRRRWGRRWQDRRPRRHPRREDISDGRYDYHFYRAAYVYHVANFYYAAYVYHAVDAYRADFQYSPNYGHRAYVGAGVRRVRKRCCGTLRYSAFCRGGSS